MSISTIKQGIKTNLDALVTADVIAGCESVEFKQDPLSENAGIYPYAYLMPPATESEALDNRTVIRTHAFTILFLFQAEDIDSAAELESDIESILSQFDNDPTLGGTALGGVLPVSSAPEPFQHGGKDLIAVEIQIQAKETVALSF